MEEAYIKIFNIALDPGNRRYQRHDQKHNIVHQILLKEDQVLVRFDGSYLVLHNHKEVLNLSKYFNNKIYCINNELITLKLTSVVYQDGDYVICSIKKLVSYKSYFEGLYEDVLMHIFDKLDYKHTIEFNSSKMLNLNDSFWRKMMIRKYPKHYKDLKDIRYDITWESIYCNCLDLNCDIYVCAYVGYNNYRDNHYGSYDLSHGLLAAISLKIYDNALFEYVKNLRIRDLNWYYLIDRSHIQACNIGDFIHSRNIPRILDIFVGNRCFPDINYIMLIILFDDKDYKLLSSAPQLLHNLYIYKHKLIGMLSVDQLRFIYDKCDLSEYPLLKVFIEDGLNAMISHPK